MEQILANLALMNTTEFCVANGIDCSGSHILKAGRGFAFSLVRSSSYEPIVTVTFHKTSSPTYVVHEPKA